MSHAIAQDRSEQLAARDSEEDSRPALIVRDGHYVSARWPGDAYLFASEFMKLLD